MDGSGTTPADAAVAQLFRLGRYSSPHELPDVVDAVVQRWWRARASVWLVDHARKCFVPLTASASGSDAGKFTIEGTMAGRAYIHGRPTVATDDTGTRIWLEISEGEAPLGVLEVHGAELTNDDVAGLGEIAAVIASLVVTGRQYTDQYYRRRQREVMTLAADMQWSQLPPPGGRHGDTTFSGLLEPAYRVAGDVFDYAVNDEVFHTAIFDAVGHNLASAVISHLVLGSYRHARRQGMSLAATHRFMDEVVGTEIGHSRFATGLLIELDLATGHLRLVNLGHPVPLLVRHGKTSALAATPTWPIGLGGAEAEVAEHVLEPGDRVLLFTDGIVEGRTPAGVRFSEDTLADLLVKATASDLSTPETLRRLIQAVIEHQDGELRDDGTMVLIDWRPSPT